MVRQHALMESLSANLHGFLHKINRHMKKPDKEFLQDALIGHKSFKIDDLVRRFGKQAQRVYEEA